jgi:hypothetical protein
MPAEVHKSIISGIQHLELLTPLVVHRFSRGSIGEYISGCVFTDDPAKVVLKKTLWQGQKTWFLNKCPIIRLKGKPDFLAAYPRHAVGRICRDKLMRIFGR